MSAETDHRTDYQRFIVFKCVNSLYTAAIGRGVGGLRRFILITIYYISQMIIIMIMYLIQKQPVVNAISAPDHRCCSSIRGYQTFILITRYLRMRFDLITTTLLVVVPSNFGVRVSLH